MIRNKRIVTILLTLVLTAVYFVKLEPAEASAGSKYITVNEFLKYIVTEMKLPVDETSDTPYIDAAKESGLIKEGEFKNYSDYLTRTDAAVIANRLDELIHLKYGYPEDVYEFLKDCRLYENVLYYDTDGKFYPKGATKETYPEERFNEEVVIPILSKIFNDEKGFRTLYEYITDRNGNIIKRYMEIGQPKKNTVMSIDPFDENSEVIRAWKTIKEGERKLNAVLEKRISDIKEIPKSKREAVAAIIAKGIMKGYSNGLYVQNREFRGKNKITASGAKEVIQKVLNPEKRALISPDGQLIRTTNLPKNAGQYPYILECFPNKFYEMNYTFMYLTDYINGTIKKEEYLYPKEITLDYLNDNYYREKIEKDRYDFYDFTISQVEQYLQHIFNVDYRTVDEEWIDGLAFSHAWYQVDWRIEDSIKNYIEKIKKYKVIVESECISVEPSTLYESRGILYIRAYVKYRVTTSDLNASDNNLIYGASSNIKQNLKNGQWKYGYYDIMFSSLYDRLGMPIGFVGITDYFFNDSFR